LGGALRAAQAVEGVPWSALYARFVSPDAGSHIRSSADASGAYGVLRATLARKLSGP
jgi:hypothetical protein